MKLNPKQLYNSVPNKPKGFKATYSKSKEKLKLKSKKYENNSQLGEGR